MLEPDARTLLELYYFCTYINQFIKHRSLEVMDIKLSQEKNTGLEKLGMQEHFPFSVSRAEFFLGGLIKDQICAIVYFQSRLLRRTRNGFGKIVAKLK